MSRKASSADYGLVGLVGGGAVLLVLSIVTIAVSALIGRLPVVLATLLGITAVVVIGSGVVVIATRDREAD
jgi:hypothetical protein